MIQSPGVTTRASLLLKIRENPEDQVAWRMFVDRFGPLIHRWCRYWKLQEADAQDITQIVLLKMARALPEFTYDPARSFRAFLRTVTQRTWSDFVDSQRRGVPKIGNDESAEVLLAVEARDDLFRRLQESFDRELAELAMERVRNRVEPHTWEAFRLTAVESVPASEVARQLGIRIGTVYRARNVVQGLLRTTMAELDAEEETVS